MSKNNHKANIKKSSKLKVLNLYAGIGGNRKLWEDVEVTAVEIDPQIARAYQENFPNDVVIIDNAHEYLVKEDNYKKYDFIWSSPPCPTHSRISINFAEATSGRIIPRYPDMKLYQEIIFLDNFFKGKYCVENVKPYYLPLIVAQQYDRHLFWCNFRLNSASQIGGQNILRGTTNDAIKKKGLEDFMFNNIDTRLAVNNAVRPETGLYILNCARNIITKSNVNQLDVFD